MATKTISLKVEAYEKLKTAKRYPNESFSEVVMRATWPESTVTASEYATLCRERGPTFGEAELEVIESLQQDDQPPADKWNER